MQRRARSIDPIFRNKNMWSDDPNGMFGAFRSSKDDKNMFKMAFYQMFDNFNVNLRKNEVFLTCIPCIPIPEYGQSNAPLICLWWISPRSCRAFIDFTCPPDLKQELFFGINSLNFLLFFKTIIVDNYIELLGIIVVYMHMCLMLRTVKDYKETN